MSLSPGPHKNNSEEHQAHDMNAFGGKKSALKMELEKGSVRASDFSTRRGSDSFKRELVTKIP